MLLSPRWRTAALTLRTNSPGAMLAGDLNHPHLSTDRPNRDDFAAELERRTGIRWQPPLGGSDSLAKTALEHPLLVGLPAPALHNTATASGTDQFAWNDRTGELSRVN
jgi:hypothetical protein